MIALLCVLEFMWSHTGVILAKSIAMHLLTAAKDRVVPYGLDAARRFADVGDIQSLLQPMLSVEGNSTHTAFLSHLTDSDSGLGISLESGVTAVQIAMMLAGWFQRRAARR